MGHPLSYLLQGLEGWVPPLPTPTRAKTTRASGTPAPHPNARKNHTRVGDPGSPPQRAQKPHARRGPRLRSSASGIIRTHPLPGGLSNFAPLALVRCWGINSVGRELTVKHLQNVSGGGKFNLQTHVLDGRAQVWRKKRVRRICQ